MYNSFEISLVVFMPNITTNHAITYTYFFYSGNHNRRLWKKVAFWRGKRSKEKIWGGLSIRWALVFPFFCPYPFWCTFAVLLAHKNSSTPECTPNHQGEKIRKVPQHIICTHQQSVPLSVDQPVKTNHWDCFGYCADVNSLFMIQSTVKTTDYWGMTFH